MDPRLLDSFEEFKTYLSSPPLLVSPDDASSLDLDLTTSDNVIAAILIKEKEGIQ